MSIINQPEDILGLALKNVLTPMLTKEKVLKKIKNWQRIIVVEIIGLYEITLIFDNSEITIEYGEKPKYHLKIKMTLDALIAITEGRMGLISAFLRRKLKVKKIYRIFTIYKFQSILVKALHLVNKTYQEA